MAYGRGADPAPVDMNWTCVVYGGPMILAILWYIIDAHKWFKGPRVRPSMVVTNDRLMLSIACWETLVPCSKEKELALQRVAV